MIQKFPRWIEFVFVTPSHHRIHHAVNPDYIDKNYAGVFIVWDRILGTFQEEVEEPVYGITKPINSYNPLWANFHLYKEVFSNLIHANSIKEALLYLFSYPGYNPETKTRDLSIHSRNQFKQNMNPKNKIFIFLFFGLIVISSLVLIRLSPSIPISILIFCIFFLILAFGVLGKYIDNLSSI